MGLYLTLKETPVSAVVTIRFGRNLPEFIGVFHEIQRTAANAGLSVPFLKAIPAWAAPVVEERIARAASSETSLMTVEAYGWPVACMWMWRLDGSTGGAPPLRRPQPVVSSGPSLPFGNAVLPVMPLPLRLLESTAFWAALWAIVLLGVPYARRRYRRMRERCATCNYDLKGLGSDAACPECGTTRTRA